MQTFTSSPLVPDHNMTISRARHKDIYNTRNIAFYNNYEIVLASESNAQSIKWWHIMSTSRKKFMEIGFLAICVSTDAEDVNQHHCNYYSVNGIYTVFQKVCRSVYLFICLFKNWWKEHSSDMKFVENILLQMTKPRQLFSDRNVVSNPRYGHLKLICLDIKSRETLKPWRLSIWHLAMHI